MIEPANAQTLTRPEGNSVHNYTPNWIRLTAAVSWFLASVKSGFLARARKGIWGFISAKGLPFSAQLFVSVKGTAHDDHTCACDNAELVYMALFIYTHL